MQYLEKYNTRAGIGGLALSEQARSAPDWRRARRWEMAELVDRQQRETEGELQFHSRLAWVARDLVPCWNQTHACIFESVQLEGSYAERT